MKLCQVIENILKNVFVRSSEEIGSVMNLIDSEKNIYLPQKNNQMEIVPIEDVLFVHEVKKDLILIRTLTMEYEYNNAACNIVQYLTKLSESFQIVNSGLCINKDRVECYDSYQRKIYFVYDEKVSNSLFVHTNARAEKLVQKILGIEKDLHHTKNRGAIFI